jgi:hypothetical protein
MARTKHTLTPREECDSHALAKGRQKREDTVFSRIHTVKKWKRKEKI